MDSSKQDVTIMGSNTKAARLRQAIAALDDETNILNRQTRVLETQTAALTRSHSWSGKRISRSTSTAESTAASNAREIISNQTSNDALAISITTDLQDHDARLAKDARNLPGHVTTRLKADDRALAATLERAGRLEDGSKAEAEFMAVEARIQKLVKVLHAKKVEDLKNRLDAAYLQSLASHAETTSTGTDGDVGLHDTSARPDTQPRPMTATTADGEEAAQAQIFQLQADISTLYTEIEDVTTMLINQEHSLGLQKTIARIRTHRQQAEQMVLRHALLSLRDMTTKAVALAEQAQAVSAQRRVLQEIETQLGCVQREARIKSGPATASSKTTTSQGAATKATSGALRAGRDGSHVSRADELIGKAKQIDDILRAALETRLRAVATLPVKVEYSDEVAGLEAVEQRIGSMKGTLETITSTVGHLG
ncbi:uncharacterized protein AB675_2313 [Cyphellophora attinorum]|uniref:Uncharacterized protein n=1 Tax=Cyphellophora attinorum TaxID=1664694 RepID=A0A0N1HAW2_9EURO|nr:uncharacterized protein AB675_2313 [Phialophora attinorum]KPI45206.1 hypothetical protein AB675_2313 [Phialophora attinorum]